MKLRLSARKGLSLSELIVGMVILGVIGMALTRIMVTQARYFDHQKTSNMARNVSRGPLNRVVSDLRMVEAEGGITAASATSITARVPYAIGVVCISTGGATHISLLPVDSAMYAAPGYSGYAWRNGEGRYEYRMTSVTNSSLSTGVLLNCTNAAVGNLTADKAKVVAITPQLSDTADVGTPVFLLRNIQYSFKASTAIPGTTGLYRKVVATGAEEELSAPYANDAKFRFYIKSSTTAVDAPPANLSTLRGIEMNMTGQSERVPRQGVATQKAPFVTAVFFKNRLN
ncbi:MAG TPA: prepilin-type N-terminal cleavage/methylation domain-containing protein [Gemmatimonadaceae bacterium]|nr:prepilin-type N-terminal cleavage/methylation domain-containing protein [Gemmatimonadaceae bacterium]